MTPGRAFLVGALIGSAAPWLGVLIGHALGDDLPIPPPKYAPPGPAASRPPSSSSRPAVPSLPLDPTEDGGGSDPRDTPPPVFYGEEIESETDSLIYVIDLSGSMDGDPVPYVRHSDGRTKHGNRYERARDEVLRSIAGLASSIRFTVVGFDCHVDSVTAPPELLEADAAGKARAVAWLRATAGRDDQSVAYLRRPPWGGQTGTGPAVSYALQWRDNRAVVLLTDGGPNCPWPSHARHRRVIRQANAQQARIDVFGIGAKGRYRAFCVGVASDNGGTFHDVP